MSRRFWFWVRITGWIILLIWYVIFAYNAIWPVIGNPTFNVTQAVVGIVATLLILIGYIDLEKTVRRIK